MENKLNVGIAQISPIWLNREKTIDKVCNNIAEAADQDVELLVFGEALVPGYPYWLALTEGAKWDLKINKELHAHYAKNAVSIEKGHLDSVCKLAEQHEMAIYLGIIERPLDRGGHSVYASLVYIDPEGEIKSVHRKLQPTYDERLTWAQGDGHGLKVHPLKEFNLGGLNCWENWMPLARTALYAQGENLHVAVWPGSDYNTKDITRFIARESRSFVISASGLMAKKDFPKDTPYFEVLSDACPETLSNGGSCIAGPDGEFLMAPQTDFEGILTHSIDFNRVLEERQNFDAVGHYSRPDVTRLVLNTERQGIISKNPQDFQD